MENINIPCYKSIQENNQRAKEEIARKTKREQLKKARQKQIRTRIAIFVGLALSQLTVIVSAANTENVPETEIKYVETVYSSPDENVSTLEVLVEETEKEIVETPSTEKAEEKTFTYNSLYATPDEIWLYEQIVMAECYSYFTEEEMLMIASAIRNRIESDKYPDSITGVLTQKTQFETYTNERYLKVKPNEKCKRAVERALAGDTNLPKDVMFFCTVEYYEQAAEDVFFKTHLKNVPEYNFRNVMMFVAK